MTDSSEKRQVSSNEIDVIRDEWASRAGSQKGQYRLPHSKTGTLLSEILRLEMEVDRLQMAVSALRPNALETSECPGHYKVAARNVCVMFPHCLCGPEARVAAKYDCDERERHALKANAGYRDPNAYICLVHKYHGAVPCLQCRALNAEGGTT